MKQATQKLWNKNFLLFIAGMEFNLIGTNLLKFVLPLYVLLETGNPALMGTVLTFSTIPLILFLPVGGIAADRFSKKTLLVFMNFATAITIAIYFAISGTIAIVPATVIFFLLFSSFESMITPTVESSVPFLVPKNDLVKANSVTWMLTMFSNVGSPAIGGFVLARFGLTSALYICIALYAIATVIKLIVQIPFTKQKTTTSLPQTIISDLKDGFRFVTKENPKMSKLMLASAFTGLFLVPLSTVALPVLVSTHLGMGEEIVGIMHGIVMFGGTAGIILLGVLSGKMNITKMRSIFVACSFALIIAGLGIMWIQNTILTLVFLVASFFIATGLSVMFAVMASAYMGEKSPEHLVGKVMSLYFTATWVGLAIGNYAFGRLFEHFIETPSVALLTIAGFATACSLFMRIKE